MKLLFTILLGLMGFSAVAQHVPINIITYNIRMNTQADGENRWDMRKDDVRALLQFHDADIFCVQEALPEQFDYLKATPGFTAVGVGREDGARKGEFSAVYFNNTRFKMLKQGTFWLSETPEKVSKGWDAALERICTWVKLYDTKNKREFMVFNTHFDHIGVQARSNAGILIKQQMQKIGAGLPVILTGDLNVTPDKPAIVTLKTFLHDAKEVSKEKPYGPEGTFEGFKWDAPLKDKIDYIFVNDGFKVLKHAILTDSKNMRYPSDHLPVLARVSF